MMAGAVTLNQAGLAYRQYDHPRDALLEWLTGKPRHQTFHALTAINLSLAPGASLGIVGDNGAGKSSLLRLLAGYLQPSSGQCIVKGRRSALLELGTGLHPEFNAIDNARTGLALRGLSADEIEARLPEVLAFAELGDFQRQPVKTYSSGMAVRLVFAIAAVIEPDVLIVDEALAVGDQYFQKKSLDRMRGIIDKGATLVFCSHNLYQVRELCEQALWLEQGSVRMLGPAQQVVDAYQDASRRRSLSAESVDVAQAESDQVSLSVRSPQAAVSTGGHRAPVLLSVKLEGGNMAHAEAGPLPNFATYQRFAVGVRVATAGVSMTDLHVGIVLRRNDDIQCYGISTLHDGVTLVAGQDGESTVRFVIDSLPLLSGEYCLEVWLIDGSGLHVYDARERCCPFRVQQASQAQGVGVNWIPHRWETGVEVGHHVETC